MTKRKAKSEIPDDTNKLSKKVCMKINLLNADN